MGKSILGKENDKCKGPEVGTCIDYFRNSKEANEGGEGWSEARGGRGQIG